MRKESQYSCLCLVLSHIGKLLNNGLAIGLDLRPLGSYWVARYSQVLSMKGLSMMINCLLIMSDNPVNLSAHYERQRQLLRFGYRNCPTWTTWGSSDFEGP